MKYFSNRWAWLIASQARADRLVIKGSGAWKKSQYAAKERRNDTAAQRESSPTKSEPIPTIRKAVLSNHFMLVLPSNEAKIAPANLELIQQAD